MKRSRKILLCERSGKRKLKTEEEAERVMKKTIELRGSNGAKRYYLCDHCGHFHLTSKVEHRQPPQRIKLTYAKDWFKLLKNETNETTLDTRPDPIQTHKRYKERLESRLPSGSEQSFFNQFRTEVSEGRIQLVREFELSSPIVGRERT